MDIEKDDTVIIYEKGECIYTGEFGELSKPMQETVSDAVFLFRLHPNEDANWLCIFWE